MADMLKKIAWQFKRILPRSTFRAARDAGTLAASTIKALERRRMPRVDRATLVRDLRKGGIKSGAVLFVHSSLSKIGDVEGGADAVVDALIEAVGTRGTIVMPAFSSAEDFMLECKRGTIVDLRTSPSHTGKITEALRKRSGTFRSSHPFSSCIAWGRHAEYVTSGHAADAKIWHESSPLARVLELRGTILGLGTGLGTVTMYHCAEDLWDGFPFRTYGEPFVASYIDAHGNAVTRLLLRYDPHVSQFRIDHPYGDWIRTIFQEHLAAAGVLRPRFTVGCATAWTMNAKALFEETKSLAALGVTIYSRPSEEIVQIVQARKAALREVRAV